MDLPATTAPGQAPGGDAAQLPAEAPDTVPLEAPDPAPAKTPDPPSATEQDLGLELGLMISQKVDEALEARFGDFNLKLQQALDRRVADPVSAPAAPERAPSRSAEQHRRAELAAKAAARRHAAPDTEPMAYRPAPATSGPASAASRPASAAPRPVSAASYPAPAAPRPPSAASHPAAPAPQRPAPATQTAQRPAPTAQRSAPSPQRPAAAAHARRPSPPTGRPAPGPQAQTPPSPRRPSAPRPPGGQAPAPRPGRDDYGDGDGDGAGDGYDAEAPVREPIAPVTERLDGFEPLEGPDGAEPAFDAETVYDRAFGAILGLALGDAFGLQVEGDDAETIAERHPDGLKFPYRGSFRGFQPNDWTDATDFAVLVMRTLVAYFTSKSEDPASDFAARVVRWHKSGFAELGDTMGLAPESVVGRVLAIPGFARAPAGAARAVKGPKAENGALIRAVACAFTAAPVDWAVLLAEATHADTRCSASAATFVLLLRDLARARPGAHPSAAALVAPVRAGRGLIAEEPRRAEFVERLTRTTRLADLGLGARESRSYTVKTLACAAWALRQLARAAPETLADQGAAFFRETIGALAAQGGDASANCAVAGAVLGATLGHAGLPQDWLAALPHREWLEKEIAAFVQAASKTWAEGGS